MKIASHVQTHYGNFPNYGLVCLVLPVDDRCTKIIKRAIKYYKPTHIICFGESMGQLRIETTCTSGKGEKIKTYHASWASNIKKKCRFLKTEGNIGDYYCNDVYKAALDLHPRTIFIHTPPFLTEYKTIDKLMKKILNEK
jgi:hypothetical protein